MVTSWILQANTLQRDKGVLLIISLRRRVHIRTILGKWAYVATLLAFHASPATLAHTTLRSRHDFTFSKGQHMRPLRYLRMQNSENVSRRSRPSTKSGNCHFRSILSFLSNSHQMGKRSSRPCMASSGNGAQKAISSESFYVTSD